MDILKNFFWFLCILCWIYISVQYRNDSCMSLVFPQFIDWLFSLTEAPEECLSQIARGETL